MGRIDPRESPKLLRHVNNRVVGIMLFDLVQEVHGTIIRMRLLAGNVPLWIRVKRILFLGEWVEETGVNDARYIIFFFNFLTPLLSLSLSLVSRVGRGCGCRKREGMEISLKNLTQMQACVQTPTDTEERESLQHPLKSIPAAWLARKSRRKGVALLFT